MTTYTRTSPTDPPTGVAVVATGVGMVVCSGWASSVSACCRRRPTVVAGEEDPSVAGDVGNDDGAAVAVASSQAAKRHSLPLPRCYRDRTVSS